MHKILFPEAGNEYIQVAAKTLEEEQVCIPVLEDVDCIIAGQKLSNGEADAMVLGVDRSSRDVILACRDQIGVAGRKENLF